MITNLRSLDNRTRALIFLVIAGLVGNATIVVAFSSLASRYQARVVWVLPLFVLSLAVAQFRNGREKANQSEGDLRHTA
jgi:putative copper export protein